MKEQQFAAKDTNGVDVTKLAAWEARPASLAAVVAGLATGLKPGEASITATLGGQSGSANLAVMCRLFTQYYQNQSPWGPRPLGYYTSVDLPQKSFAWIACALTNMSNIAGITPELANSMILAAANPLYRYSGNADAEWWAVNYLSNGRFYYDEINSAISDIDATGFTNDPYPISTIDHFLSHCNTVIVGIKGTYGGKYRRNHYILITGKKANGSYKVNDTATYTGISELPANTEIYSHIVFLDN